MQTLFETNSFKGVHTALVTPFLPDGSIDWKNFDALLDRQIAGKVHGVVPCGTTGESPTLKSEEKLKLISACVKRCKGQTKVIAGTGSNDTIETIENTIAAAEAGADAALVVVPYYNKPSQNGLVSHFNAIAEESKIPIFLYNVPGRTGISMTPGTVAELAKNPKIIGIKEASGNLATLSEMRIAVSAISNSKNFIFLSGDDLTFWPFLITGGHGVISVASNIFPETMIQLYSLFQNGNIFEGLTLHEKFFPFFSSLFIEANPVPAKAVLAWQGFMQAKCRLPLTPLQTSNSQTLQKIFEALK